MTAKHTPGPWRDCEPGSNFAKSKKFIRPVGDEKLIAVVSGERPFLEVTANARLIAAAPALADALEKCAKLTRLQHDSPETVRWIGEEVGRIAATALRAAGRLP